MKPLLPLTFILLFSSLFSFDAIAKKKNDLNVEIIYPQDSDTGNYGSPKTVLTINDWNTYSDATTRLGTSPGFNVDFQVSQVVIIDWGVKGTSASQVRILNVKERADFIQVNVRYTFTNTEDLECSFPAALFRPLAIVKIDSKKPIFVREFYQELTCADSVF
ncbi:hypothetical protein [Thalassotalea sp. Y01]|uniref:hypothetical protein n=1 Tax=Thalassotalea sp. Y01 TaxID=2729613 RepID=UPI00145F06DD|nr:hypothetical protein [Thalassotalea sp. Y01]NMP15104.1 hypothetical protein [Thalassotalea sp. Y01]